MALIIHDTTMSSNQKKDLAKKMNKLLTNITSADCRSEGNFAGKSAKNAKINKVPLEFSSFIVESFRKNSSFTNDDIEEQLKKSWNYLRDYDNKQLVKKEKEEAGSDQIEDSN